MRSAHSRAGKSVLACVAAVSIMGVRARTASPFQVPPLPPPTGNIIDVSTESELQEAVASAGSGTTILIAPGVYRLTASLYVNSRSDLTIRGATDNRDDVVLVGHGMAEPDPSDVPFGIWSNSVRTTIANLTIRDVQQHPIIFNPGAESPHVYNVHLIDAGEQFLKSNPDGAGGGVNGGMVEYSVFEYTTTAKDDYTNAIDVHAGREWTVRHNLFANIKAPDGQLAGPAVLFWNGSSGAIVEGNTFIHCQREISMGLQPRDPFDNQGGIVRNNFVYRDPGEYADVAIYVGDSRDTEVLHNTVVVRGTYENAIEYRFPGTTGAFVYGNLVDAGIQSRDGATGTVEHNHLGARPTLFVDAVKADLHLIATAIDVIDQVPPIEDAPNDWDGHTRPQGAAADYGADEYVFPASSGRSGHDLDR